MELIDISLSLGARTAVYDGDPRPRLEPLSVASSSDPVAFGLTRLSLSTHMGTHVDPPLHFVPGGVAVDALPLELLCGSARVARLEGRAVIDERDLAGLDLSGVERLLFKTDNARLPSHGAFRTDYTHLSPGGARYLAEQTGVRLVGIDYLSIEAADSPDMIVHRTLLGADPYVVILEGLDLRQAEAGDYELWCLPLKIESGDGAPARAVLRRD